MWWKYFIEIVLWIMVLMFSIGAGCHAEKNNGAMVWGSLIFAVIAMVATRIFIVKVVMG